MKYNFNSKDIVKFLYWKSIRPDSAWNSIPDNPESRQTAIESGAHFFTWLSIAAQHTGDQAEPTRYGNLVLDFDSKDDPGRCLEEVKNLCLIHLPETYGLDPHCINFFASGGKGFHIEIPCSVFGTENGDPLLHLIYKKIVAEWVSSLDLHTADMSMYAGGKGKMFRIENVRRDNGRFKVPLTLEEVRTLSMAEITQLTESSRTIEPVDGADSDPVQELVEVFDRYRSEIHKDQSDRADEPDAADFTNIKDIVPCVRYILDHRPKTAQTTFNILTVNLVKYFQSAGYDFQSAILTCSEFFKRY